MGGVSLSQFFKHLTCSLRIQAPRHSHHFLHCLAPSLSSINFSHLTSSLPNLNVLQWRRFSSSCAASLSSPSISKDSTLPPYLSVLIKCRKDVADSFSEALLSFGANSVSMDEHDDYEESDEVNMCSIFTGHGDVTSCISCAADSIGIEMPTFELLEYDPYDWIKRTQESFDPVEVTRACGLCLNGKLLRPPIDIDAQATNIILNPGLAFGTGEHATTKMCLLLLHQCVKGGERFLDYGTGSGILSIAALKLGAALSVGVDIDPQAITAAHQNAELNNIEPERLKLYLLPSKDDASFVEKVQEDLHAEELPADKNFVNTDKYDIVIANILLNPLLALADEIVSLAKVGATVGLSGILHDQVMHLS
ncbi:Ribosomal protein L11 methyltransferase [Bienertia sinuspersici]